MNLTRRVWMVAAAALLAAPSLGCSSTPDGKLAKVQAGDMPPNGDWTGVWYSELYGELHLVQEGTVVSGKWMRPHKDRWGELHGNATGDLLKFSWTEHETGLVTPNSDRQGRGYFKYKRPEGDNVDDTIVGEIGRKNDEVGDPWDAVKQRHRNPDLKSIGGTGASDIGGGDWDKGNNEKGSPEAPKEPQAPAP